EAATCFCLFRAQRRNQAEIFASIRRDLSNSLPDNYLIWDLPDSLPDGPSLAAWALSADYLNLFGTLSYPPRPDLYSPLFGMGHTSPVAVNDSSTTPVYAKGLGKDV